MLESNALTDEQTQVINTYDTWKTSLDNDNLSNFIDFCITRIEQTEIRVNFIQRLTKLTAANVKVLFESMLGIALNPVSLQLPEKKEFKINNEEDNSTLNALHQDTSEAKSDETADEDNILERKVLALQQKDLLSAVVAPLSPEMKRFTEFQEWFSNKTDEDVATFNTWLSSNTSNEIHQNFTYDFLEKTELKKAKQRNFLDWYATQIKDIIAYFETQTFADLKASDDTATTQTYRDILIEFKNKFSVLLLNIKHAFQDDRQLNVFLSDTHEIAQLVNFANESLGGLYGKLAQRHAGEYYFYHQNNFTLTAMDFYQQYLNDKNWALQKETFARDPENNISNLVATILSSNSEDDIENGIKKTSLEDLLHTAVHNQNGETVPLYTTLSDEQRELLEICLNNNASELNAFIKKHGPITIISWLLPIVSYVGEAVYFVVDFMLRDKAFAPIFQAFGLGSLLEQKEAFLALNIATTFFVIIANMTFSPAAEAQHLMKAWLLNPKNSKNHSLYSQLCGYFGTHFLDDAQKNKLLFLCFAGMAFSGAAIETMAIELLQPYMSSSAYTGVFVGASAFLITSGMLYYFFMMFRDIIKGTPDAIQAFKTTAAKVFFTKEGSLTFDSTSFIAFQQMLVAVLERTFRMSYGPIVFLLGLGVPFEVAIIGGVLAGAATMGTTPATRIAQVAAAYNIDEDKFQEQLIKAKEEFTDLSSLQRGIMRLQDPFIIPTVGLSYIFAELTLASPLLSDSNRMITAPIVALISFIALAKLSQASADCKIINNLATKEKSEGTLALRLSQTACAVDQFSRSVSFVSIMSAIDAADFNTKTDTGKLLIQLVLIVSCYLGYAAYTYQSSKTNGICQDFSDWTKRKIGQAMASEPGKFFKENELEDRSSQNLGVSLVHVDSSKRQIEFEGTRSPKL